MFQPKNAHLDNMERYYIYKGAKTDNQHKDRHNICSNKICEVIIKKGRH